MIGRSWRWRTAFIEPTSIRVPRRGRRSSAARTGPFWTSPVEPSGQPIEADSHRDPVNSLSKETNEETGWSYHGARWMAPQTAGWLSPDARARKSGRCHSRDRRHESLRLRRSESKALLDPEGADKKGGGVGCSRARSGADKLSSAAEKVFRTEVTGWLEGVLPHQRYVTRQGDGTTSRQVHGTG
jgi:hypothetical protein